jgi:acyl-CoA thioesterase-1
VNLLGTRRDKTLPEALRICASGQKGWSCHLISRRKQMRSMLLPVCGAIFPLLLLPASAAEAQSVMQVCESQWYAAQASGSLGGQTWQQFLAACRTRLALRDGRTPASNADLVFVGNDFSSGSRLLASLQSNGAADGVPPFVILQEYSPSGPTNSEAIFQSAGTVKQVTFYGGGKYDFTVFTLALVANDASRNELTFTVVDAQGFSGDTASTGRQTLPAHLPVEAGNYLAFAGIGPFYPQTPNDALGSDAIYASASQPDRFPSNFTAIRPVVGQTFTVGAHGDKTATYEIAPNTFGNQGRYYGIGAAYAQASPGPSARPVHPFAAAPAADDDARNFCRWYATTAVKQFQAAQAVETCRHFVTEIPARWHANYAIHFDACMSISTSHNRGFYEQEHDARADALNDCVNDRFSMPNKPSVSATSSPSAASTVEFGTDRYGNDYRIFNVPPDNYGACRTACEADAHCQAWSYESSNPQRSNGVCWLKNPAPAATPKQITTSGVVSNRLGQASPPSFSGARTLRLVALGDSLTAGSGLPPGDVFPVRLQAALRAKGFDVEVVNAGVGGNTTADGLARYDWSVPADANALIVELGTNDMLRGVKPEATRQALATILGKAKAANLPVLLTGVRAAPYLGAEYDRAFDAVFPELAAAYGAALYPVFLEGVAGDPALNQPDGLHPNADGVKVIVERILPAVDGLLNKTQLGKTAPEPPRTPAINEAGAFVNPMYNGYRLDWCRTFETDCGAPAAGAFCKSQGFGGLIAFKFQPRLGAKTMTIGQNSVCDPRWHGCDSFEFVRCR